jgi:hypothetical protein
VVPRGAGQRDRRRRQLARSRGGLPGRGGLDGCGSGCPPYIARAGWQKDRSCDKRTTSDVSAVADPETGLAVHDTFGPGPDNGWVVVGGTSLATSLVAAMIGPAGNAGRLDTARCIHDAL